jgi:hypothetical protein
MGFKKDTLTEKKTLSKTLLHPKPTTQQEQYKHV